MPWRKFKQKQGKHGPIYNVATGVKVRQDAIGKWLLCINKGGKRYNKTFGVGRDALKKAIEAAELIAEKLEGSVPAEPRPETESKAPFFKDYSDQWHRGLAGRRSIFTIERYEEIRRLLMKRSASLVEATYSVLSGIFE